MLEDLRLFGRPSVGWVFLNFVGLIRAGLFQTFCPLFSKVVTPLVYLSSSLLNCYYLKKTVLLFNSPNIRFPVRKCLSTPKIATMLLYLSQIS